MKESGAKVRIAKGHLLSLIDLDQVTVAFNKVSTKQEICYKGALRNNR